MSTYDAAWYGVVEAEHEFQNPVSLETILLLGARLRLTPRSHVLDVCAGRCGPAIALASEYGSRFTCVEKSHVFAAAGRERAHEARVRVKVRERDAVDYLQKERKRNYDAVLCLGASFVFGGLVPTIDRLFTFAPLVVVGEPFHDLRQTVRLAESTGCRVTAMLSSSEEDWRAYESLRLRTLEAWLKDHPERRHEYRSREMAAQATRRGERRGWAILVCA